MPEAYRHLDTAVLEALVLKGPLGLSEDDISHLEGPGLQPHRRRGARSSCSPASTTPPSSCARRPIEQVRAIAAAGVNMPPKSTYFFPKVPTGLLFNPLL